MWRIIPILYFLFLSSFTPSLGKPTTLDLDPNLPFVENFVNSAPEQDFIEDRVLAHSIVNGFSEFRNLPFRKRGSLVFRLKAIPTDKSVVVVSGFDDNIRRAKRDQTEQRTYVVLKKHSLMSENYYITYVYVRDLFTGEDPGPISIAGKPKKLEFDVWDARGSKDNYDFLFGWSTCARTFFVSCVNDPISNPRLDNDVNPDYDSEEVSDFSGNQSTAVASPEPETGESQFSSLNLNFDFFTDLDDEAEHAWFVGGNIIFVTNTKLRISTTFETADVQESIPARRKRQSGQADAQEDAAAKKVATKAQIQACINDLKRKNVGGRGTGVFDKSMSSVAIGVNDIANPNQQYDGRIREGSDRRGLHGDKDNPSLGVLSPVDSLAFGIGDVFGYGGGRNSTSPGMKLANGVRNGGGLGYGLSEGAADTLGSTLGIGTISDDRSHLDGIMDEALPGVFGNSFGLAVDVVNVVAKPLGLEPLLGSLGGLVGFIWGGALGGPGAAVVGPMKLGLDFGKLALKGVGMGGLIGMKGSSNKAMDKFCLNNLLRLSAALKKRKAAKAAAKAKGGTQINAKVTITQGEGAGEGGDYDTEGVQEEPEAEQNQAEQTQAGRSFGSGKRKFGKAPEGEANVDIYTPLGWRGMLSADKQAFVGLGGCYIPKKVTTLEDLKAAKTPEEHGDLYLQILRSDCNVKQKAKLIELIETKVVQLIPDNHAFDFVSNLKAKTKLTTAEFNTLSLGFELSIFSQSFVEASKTTSKPLTPDGKNISLSVHTLHKMSLKVLNAAVESNNLHVIKLVRNQIVNLRTALVKLLQDSQVLTICRRCLLGDRLELDRDIEMVVTTILFIMDKFEPERMNSAPNGYKLEELEADFKKYYLTNLKEIKTQVELYTIFPITGAGMFG